MGSPIAKQGTKYKIEFQGNVRGRLISGYVQRTRENAPRPTILSIEDGKTKFLMYLSSNQQELRVLENPHGVNPTFYTLNRV